MVTLLLRIVPDRPASAAILPTGRAAEHHMLLYETSDGLTTSRKLLQDSIWDTCSLRLATIKYQPFGNSAAVRSDSGIASCFFSHAKAKLVKHRLR